MATFAMKVYDLQWHTTFGMSYDEAARSLVADGFDTVIAANQIDPLPQSGVDQTAYLERHRQALASYRDSDWVAALNRHGLRVLQTSAVLFDPPSLERFPDARPIDAAGQPEAMTDWYVGICPTHDGYLAQKLERLRSVTRELRPDGLFLQFMRYPGFWEDWTGGSDQTFGDADEFCFCDRCLEHFREATGIEVAGQTTAERASAILRQHRGAWDAWRCQRIAAIVRTIRKIATEIRPGLSITLNTLPFPPSDFRGRDARRTIAAQDLALLAKDVDSFELMTYLQILKRPVEWIDEAVGAARATIDRRRLLCTLQVAPLYTDGMHRRKARAADVSADELLAAGERALRAGADGLVFYHWTDFLEDQAQGGSKRDALRWLTGVGR
jgi:hypothetical protein